MPIYLLFDGIKILIYFNDHVPPHIHAQYGEFEIVVTIESQEVLKGEMPVIQLKKIQKLIRANQDELLQLFYQMNSKARRK